MSSPIQPISLASIASIQPAIPGLLTNPAQSGDAFKQIFDSAIGAVTDASTVANTEVQKVLSGQSQDIHSAMIASQKADLTFELFMGVKNKLTSAYQTIMGSQL